MSEERDIVSRTLEEHSYIGDNIRSVEDSLNDVSTLGLLQRERADLFLSSQKAFADKLVNLKKTLEYLNTNLSKHFLFEENNLMHLLDDQVTKSIIMDHEKIAAGFSKASQSIDNFDMHSLSQRDFLSIKTDVVNTVNELCYLIKAHALKEDSLLRTIKKDKE